MSLGQTAPAKGIEAPDTILTLYSPSDMVSSREYGPETTPQGRWSILTFVTRWAKKEAYLRKKMQIKATKIDEAVIQRLLNLGVLEWEPTLTAQMGELLDGEGVCLAGFYRTSKRSRSTRLRLAKSVCLGRVGGVVVHRWQAQLAAEICAEIYGRIPWRFLPPIEAPSIHMRNTAMGKTRLPW